MALKTIKFACEIDEYRIIKKLKGSKSWKEFFIGMAKERAYQIKKLNSEIVLELLFDNYRDDFKKFIENIIFYRDIEDND